MSKSQKRGLASLRTVPFIAAAVLLVPFAAHAQQKTETREKETRIEIYQSSEELKETLARKPDLKFGSTRAPQLTITVNEAAKFQEIDGFGASLTDSSGWLLSKKLTDAQRKATLEMLFDAKKGIGLSVLRQPMGASDFALEDYSYDDVPPGETDPELKKFSIDQDRAYILPILKEALALNSNLKIIASPWSPPGWMKTSDSMIRGALLPSAYGPLASYFVRFVKAYEAEGVPIFAITMQNEPVNVPTNYPGMDMTPGEQARFLRNQLGPAFRNAGIRSKILIFDHNWDLIDFPIIVLSDAKAAEFASGIATHCYGGTVTAQSELHERFPGKEIWMTECSGGEWQKGKLLEQQVRLVIGAVRNWAKAVVLWNLALNQNHEPFLGGCTTCRGIVTIKDDVSPAEVLPTVDYTALAHASKFVSPGAHRIESNTFEQGSLENVAFQNPDGSIVLVVLNGSSGILPFNIGWKGKFATYKLPPAAVATFRWNAERNVQ